jgi:rubredoxin
MSEISSSTIFTDTSQVIICPLCQSYEGLEYRVMPSPRIVFYDGATEHNEYCTDVRDYKCRNCDFTFLVEQGALDETTPNVRERSDRYGL